jgi:ComF family protein
MRMKLINRKIKRLLNGLGKIAFPDVCVCCGVEATEREGHICSFCLEDRFELANKYFGQSCSDTLLPEYIEVQHALWNYDQGGVLQDLLHNLKYEHLTGIGVELGEKLGQSMVKHPFINERCENEQAVLVPVPLHFLKFRKRGFNQAFMIAKGIQRVLEIPICDVDAVLRRKNTRSQTGFTLSQRIANMEGAFRVKKPETFKNKLTVIVDDVFTTGSTTFELASTLKTVGCGDVFIVTVAQA